MTFNVERLRFREEKGEDVSFTLSHPPEAVDTAQFEEDPLYKYDGGKCLDL